MAGNESGSDDILLAEIRCRNRIVFLSKITDAVVTFNESSSFVFGKLWV